MAVALLAQSADLIDACGSDPGFLCEWVFETTSNDTLATLVAAAGAPIAAVLILVGAWVVNRIVRRLITRTMSQLIESRDARVAAEAAAAEEEAATQSKPALAQREYERARRLTEASDRGHQRIETLSAVFKNVASIVIYTVGILMALAEFDVNLGPLIAGAGIAGVALGFGAQSLVKDFLSGIFMIIEDQYGVGDIVDIGEASGVVERVNLRTTDVRDINGTLWHVPNGEILRVGNMSQAWARTVLDIDVAYDTDLAHAMRVIKEVADEVWNESPPDTTILEEPEVWGVQQFGPDAITIRLSMKVEPAEQFATARLVRGRLKEAFDAEGIEIPFPQRTVWLNQVASGPDSRGPVAVPPLVSPPEREHRHEEIVATKQAEGEVDE